ncbi:MAG: hypothetical protein KDA22_00075 [Phycisphaerales bacterium]|nr:hypothetical protein [Phycisphaerales bacterium]
MARRLGMCLGRAGGTALVAVLVAALFAGCLERKERITVYENGLVEVTLENSSDSLAELEGPDPLPGPFAGWMVETGEELQDDGKMRHTLRATALFPPDVPLPETWAAERDPVAPSALRFPTTVTIETRRDGTWYHFRRVYEPRAWAAVAHLQDVFLKAPMANLEGTPPDALTPEQRQSVANALARYEAERMILFGRHAFFEITPERGQDGWLLVEDRLRAVAQEAVVGAGDLLVAPPGETPTEAARRNKAIEDATTRFKAQLKDALQLALRQECSYGGTELQHFFASLDRQQTTFEVTEDLNDDSFEITLQLPGTVMATNAASHAGGAATWSFRGDELHDRSIELMASSRVGR